MFCTILAHDTKTWLLPYQKGATVLGSVLLNLPPILQQTQPGLHEHAQYNSIQISRNVVFMQRICIGITFQLKVVIPYTDTIILLYYIP